MKKIPTLFVRKFENRKIVDITDEITPGCEEAFYEGVATIKVDGACCAVINGAFYRRYDAKRGKKPPEGAIPCCDPDPVTGHWPHWVKASFDDPSDKWYLKAITNFTLSYGCPSDGTYEAVGPHFQGNPYNYDQDTLIKHGTDIVNVGRDFNSIKTFLLTSNVEGLVFWLGGEPVCKIKRSDFGFSWPAKGD